MATSRYMVNSDYLITIQDTQLNEYVQSNQDKLNKAEKLAQEEISSYLTQRYDMAYEFTNTGAFNPTLQYKVHDRVIIDYNDYSVDDIYSPGNCVIYNDDGYICTATSSGTFSTGDWTNLGAQYTLYNVFYPEPLFNDLLLYSIGDKVFWNGYIYTCQSPSHILTYTEQAQYLYLQNVPGINVFPDSPYNSNNQYWQKGASYSVPVGTLPTNTTYWEEGDNRCLQILYTCVDIVLFYLGKSLAPKNDPEMRKTAYTKACKFLEEVAGGNYNINALARQSGKGTMFRFGGNAPDAYNW